MDMQNVSSLQIPEGAVRTVHDKDGKLLWGRLAYDTKYEGNIFQQTYGGKNLLPSNGLTVLEADGITFTPVYNENNELLYINANGTYTGSNTSVYYSMGRISFISGETYTCSGCNTGSNATYRIWVESSASSGAFPAGNRLFSSDGPHTAIASANENNVRVSIQVFKDKPLDNVKFYPQIEKSDTATAYEPYVGGTASPNPGYPQTVNVVTGTQTITISDGTNSQNYTVNLGSTELYKIGAYQDYIYKSGDDWYVHKSVGKTTYSGGSGESWNLFGNNSGFFIANSDVLAPLTATDVGTMAVKSQYYLSCDFNSIYNSLVNYGIALYGATSPRNRVCIRNKDISTAADFKTWLSTHNMTVCYALATPTDTKITDNTLIGQLDAIHQWLTRYGYNATVSGNLPIIIDKTNL